MRKSLIEIANYQFSSEAYLFKGKLANLLIFDYTLTDTEIKNIYLNGLVKNKVR